MHLQNLRFLFLVAFSLIPSDASIAQGPTSAFNRDPWPESQEGPVKVFVLAGQSNMQGHAALRTLEYLIYNEETAAEYQHWKDRDGRWYERSDVWIWTTDGNRSGKLKPGFGASDIKMGPELGFGWVLGEHFQEQVLLIKTCWGGRSVRRDFLSPSSDRPSEEKLQQELKRSQKRRTETTMDDIKATYGKAYRDMIANVDDVLANLDQHFPSFKKERGYELAGFVWFQGWNDMVDGDQRQEQYTQYTQRLGNMLRDVRRDLKAPHLPIVIGELGASGQRGEFQLAQKAVTELPGLAGTSRFVKTVEFWDPKVAEMVNQGVWKGPDWVQFYNRGSDRGYHYLGSAKIQYQMGKSFGRAMTEMLSNDQSN